MVNFSITPQQIKDSLQFYLNTFSQQKTAGNDTSHLRAMDSARIRHASDIKNNANSGNNTVSYIKLIILIVGAILFFAWVKMQRNK